MTQTQEVLRHLKDRGSITSYEAFAEYGITRLSARIHDLRKCGWNIESGTQSVVNRYGKKVHFAKYTLKEKE